jgi:hypothetical protein
MPRILAGVAAMLIAFLATAFAASGADLYDRGREAHRCGPRDHCWRGCPDGYSCYPLYGAYGPYGGAAYWGAYSYTDAWDYYPPLGK